MSFMLFAQSCNQNHEDRRNRGVATQGMNSSTEFNNNDQLNVHSDDRISDTRKGKVGIAECIIHLYYYAWWLVMILRALYPSIHIKFKGL